MAHTPYPAGGRELPNICCSHDGETWVEPAGISNPIYTAAQILAINGEFAADTELCLLPNGQMAVFFSVIDLNPTVTIEIVRGVSSDGINWTFSIVGGTGHGDPNDQWTSVSVFVEDDGTTLRMFANGGSTGLVTRTSADNGATWGNGVQVNIPTHPEILSWHSQVKKVNGEYHCLWMNKFDTVSPDWQSRLFYFKSVGNDPLNFTGDTTEPIYQSPFGDWDAHWNYRSCFVPRPGSFFDGGIVWDMWIVGIPQGGSANPGTELTHPWKVRFFRDVIINRDERPLSRRDIFLLAERTKHYTLDKSAWKLVNSGSAGAGTTRQALRLYTGSTTASSVFAVPNTEGTYDSVPIMERGQASGTFNWKERFRLSFGVNLLNINNSEVNLIFALGPQGGSSDITSTQPGFRLIINKDRTDAECHNGTTNTVHNDVLGGTLSSTRYHEFAVEFDGQGNVLIFMDGQLKTTVGGAPLNHNTGYGRAPAFKLENGASTYSAIAIVGMLTMTRVTA